MSSVFCLNGYFLQYINIFTLAAICEFRNVEKQLVVR